MGASTLRHTCSQSLSPEARAPRSNEERERSRLAVSLLEPDTWKGGGSEDQLPKPMNLPPLLPVI